MSKSRRKKKKFAPKRERKTPSIAEQPQVAPVEKPSSIASPSVAPPRYPYIATELRTIGILAGVMTLLLVVLRFVLT